MRCFVHFDLLTCFAPQQRAIFRHLSFKKWSEHAVFCTSWLANGLRTRAVCHFPDRNFKNGSEPAVFWHFDLQMCFAPQRRAIFISLLKSYSTSAPAALASLLFEHQEPRIIEINTAIRDFPNISRVCIFFLVTLLACWSSFFWLDFSSLLFNCPYCRKLDF